MNIAIACYGDGAANQGQIWEAANMAKLWGLPLALGTVQLTSYIRHVTLNLSCSCFHVILFACACICTCCVIVIENNHYGMGTSTKRHSCNDDYYTTGGNTIPGM